MERELWLLVPIVVTTMLLHLAVRRSAKQPMEAEEEMEGYDGEFQLLNLR